MYKDLDREMAGGSPRLDEEGERMRVLIVDDDPVFRGLLTEISRSLGYEVAEAEDGRQAMRLLAGVQPHVMVLDIFMPDQDGIETMRLLKGMSPRPRVIAMSGAYSGQFLTLAKALGADATLAKPFTVDRFAAAVDSVCAKV